MQAIYIDILLVVEYRPAFRWCAINTVRKESINSMKKVKMRKNWWKKITCNITIIPQLLILIYYYSIRKSEMG